VAVAAVVRPEAAPVAMELKGIDVFVYWPSRNPNTLAEAVSKLAGDGLSLQMIDNRGVKVWPAGRAETFCTDSFRCRFIAEGAIDMSKLLDVARRISDAGIDIAVTETLRNFDGKAGFTLAQGQ
jgi:isocitrate dehydrogenase